MINSRPITYIYDDPSEPSPLTPAHFLIGKRLLYLPVTRVSREDLTGSRPSLLKRYRHQQNLLNQFWNRWRKHYFLSLRSMNICPPSKVTCQFKVDDVVLIHDDPFPRNLWSMGKIIETYTGRDGKIRSCLVKTKNNAMRRPVQLLYNLEV
ncbi:integrase catalytic domain-containing protein [Trichonephila clavata]|uniref:Integrase catalytic domain-containing protein n=1 Tax=Trichonephila clavata TaxID=2740835 RepID=A0A8X6KL39_TRICU|nr:integrase catalytic domain-containing protein [Trichonephila clavata]